MPVPLLDVNAQNLPLEPELKLAFERVLRSGQFILGPDVALFEKEIAELTGVRHAVGVSSGTDAILLALMALDIKSGDEVLCPSFTFFATAGCISRAGATPVFVDSCPICFNLDVADAAKKLSGRTKAIIPVHLFGQCAAMDPVLGLATEHAISVIEDAAQALGAGYKGRRAGSMGTMGTFSFFPSKNLGGFGDSGMLVTNDDTLAERAQLLRTHGAKPKYYHQFVGANFRIDTMQAALLRIKLQHYQTYTERRQRNAAFYSERLSKLPGVFQSHICSCGNNSGSELPTGIQLILPASHSETEHIWNQYTLRVVGSGRRDALKRFLGEKGIGCEIYYPVPLHRQECFRYLGCDNDALPIAMRLADEVLSIPIYPELKSEQLEEVVAAIAAFLRK
ncbi:MAG: Glutamine--scyllo-inositol transaminase [Verrucomicrobiales bacterium]|jgi:dTDP-4-amino-4,6-dideoxygalactose transaminase|nr:Glutamine--scyllo-inositol transaminase [Verrucomicrobiales bacterium]